MPRGRRGKEVREFQEQVFNSLTRMFGENNVKKEWNVAKDSRDDFTRRLYCPRIDVAVGPFRIDRNSNHIDQRMNQELSRRRRFVKALFRNSENQRGDFNDFLENRNENPRCFLAIEIENSGSRKHMLGDIANASIIGSIGLIIPFNEKKLNHFRKIEEFVNFATEVRKIRVVFKNILIISKENFLSALHETQNYAGRENNQEALV
jgi:hypothetical protein